AYHQGTTKTAETIDVAVQAFQYKTHGWSYTWGAGAEVWVWKKIALYADLGIIQLRGAANTGGEAQLNDSVHYVFTGAKFALTSKWPAGRSGRRRFPARSGTAASRMAGSSSGALIRTRARAG